MLCTAPLTAASPGSLEVNTGAAFSGTYGLEVTLGDCRPSDETISGGTIFGPHTGCEILDVRNVQVISPGATFTAGTVVLGDGFSVAANASLTVVNDADLDPFAYVENNAPSEFATYSAVFHTRLDGLDLQGDDRLVHFTGFSEDNTELFRVVLLHNATLDEDRVIVEARQDDGSYESTQVGQQLLLPPAYNRIEIDWLAGGGDGFLLVGVNTAPMAGVAGLTNASAGRLDFVRWGAVGGDLTTSTGALQLDAFSSFE